MTSIISGTGTASLNSPVSQGTETSPTAVVAAGGNRKTLGSVFVKHRTYTILIGAFNATSFVAVTAVYTSFFNVEEFNEVFVIGTLVGSGTTASPASGTWAPQVNDSFNGTSGTSTGPHGWINHPDYATPANFTPTTVAAPGFFVPQFIGKVNSCGDLLRVTVTMSGPWTTGGQLNVYIKCKV